MSRIGYWRVSSGDQSVASQRAAIGAVDHEFVDEGVSGGVPAAQRPGFAALLAFVRPGDTVAVFALDRIGRDALDVQSVVRGLIDKGVTLDVRGIGPVGRGVGEVVVAVLSQLSEIEKRGIRERCEAGRSLARKSLNETGRTHRGKNRLGGRPQAHDAATVLAWRKRHEASITQTAAHFNVSLATVKRYCAAPA